MSYPEVVRTLWDPLFEDPCDFNDRYDFNSDLLSSNFTISDSSSAIQPAAVRPSFPLLRLPLKIRLIIYELHFN